MGIKAIISLVGGIGLIAAGLFIRSCVIDYNNGLRQEGANSVISDYQKARAESLMSIIQNNNDAMKQWQHRQDMAQEAKDFYLEQVQNISEDKQNVIPQKDAGNQLEQGRAESNQATGQTRKNRSMDFDGYLPDNSFANIERMRLDAESRIRSIYSGAGQSGSTAQADTQK